MKEIINSRIQNRIKVYSQYLLLPICVFLLFKKPIDFVLSKYFITPFLSLIGNPSWEYDVATIGIAIIMCAPIYLKIKKHAVIPLKWVLLMISVCVFYTSYRTDNEFFQFTQSYFIPFLRLTDIAFGSIALLLLLNIAKGKSESKHVAQGIGGFKVDEARMIHQDDDKLNLYKFIQELLRKIKLTQTPNGSFPIGIVAEWGSGKTTFINSLVDELRKSNFIVIECNIWKANSPSQVIDLLFKKLKAELSYYSFTIDNKIEAYSNSLLKGSNSDSLNITRNLAQMFSNTEAIENQYDSINAEIKRIDKKLVIVIDDIDRLNKDEILEVIRTIRNTANFANTFFIVAYDRNYILSALEQINPHRTHYYLEKIFQLEFTLPPVSINALKTEIQQSLKSILSHGDMDDYTNWSKRDFALIDMGSVDLTELFIFNMRDVIRFINSFQLRYDFVKDEVYFPDFYNLELIRFKHPELHSHIYKRRRDFFTIDSKKRNIGNVYSLAITESDSEESYIKSNLHHYILQSRDLYKLSQFDIDTISKAWDSIFPQQGLVEFRQKSRNGHLSVIHPSMFDRYFLLGIEGRLSEIEFSKIRALSLEDMKRILASLSKDSTLVDDIINRLIQIKDFDNKEDFEKIITSIFFFANLPSPTDSTKQINYDGRALCEMLFNDKHLIFYDDERDSFISFIKSHLYTNLSTYTYTNDFVSSLLHENYYVAQRFLEKEIIQDILLANFKSAIRNASHFTKDIYWHFMRCQNRIETPSGGNAFKITYPLLEEAKSTMRGFIINNDNVDEFILFSIYELPFNRLYGVNEAILTVFKSVELFVYILNRYVVNSKYKSEFSTFYKAITTTHPKGVPDSFFKEIPIEPKN